MTGGFPGVVLAREPRPGPGLARNRGVELARAPILAFTDADCLPEPGWAAAILARFAADPGLAILGGEVRVAIATPGGRPPPRPSSSSSPSASADRSPGPASR